MRVRLANVREKTFRWEEIRELSLEDLSRPELVRIGPVAWQGEIRFISPDFLLTASLAYDQTLVCDRCLNPAEDRVAAELQLLITTVAPSVTEALELEARDLGRVVVEDDEVDLDPLLIEQVQLHVPMKPLCRPECAGLCAQCGADLNQGPCGCQHAGGDARWTALAALKAKLPEG